MEGNIRFLDAAAIAVYLAVMAGVGLYFARRNETTEDYFVGGRNFPGWVLGLSMLGTIVSSVTFLALPAAAFVLDWRQLTVNLVLPFVAVLAVLVFIPLFRHGSRTTAFEYLGLRYGALPRLYGTVSFLIMQLIRMAQILFLVSLPIHVMTGAPIAVVIVVGGLFIAFYTIAGGIEAVVWTDVVQALVLMVGGVLCFVTIALDLPGGFGQIVSTGIADQKFGLGPLDWNLNERTFWTVLILGVINWLAIYSGDQNMVQRYAAAKSTREARKATILYSCLALPMWVMFFFVGTSLYVYYQQFPDTAVTALESANQADQILPYFILNRIPAGLAGIVIAAVLAAAMSSLDSGINAVSTVCVVDVLRPYLKPGWTDKQQLRAARTIAAIASILVILGALVFTQIEKESMNDISLIATSLFGGCLMGLFLLGFFTTRVDGVAATVAMGAAILVNIYLGLGTLEVLPVAMTVPLHSYWTAAAVNGVFIAVALTIGWLRPKTGNLADLTVWTMSKNGGL